MATVDQPVHVPPKRPVGVTVLVVIGVIQGLLVTASGVVLLAASNDSRLVRETELPENALAPSAVSGIVLGVAGLLLAVGLARGSNLVRALYATIATAEVAVTTYGLLTVRDLRTESIVGLVLPVVVLWLLFGAPHTTEFFDR